MTHSLECAFSVRQWAAVRTYRSLINDPPQFGVSSSSSVSRYISSAIQGNSNTAVSFPLAIRSYEASPHFSGRANIRSGWQQTPLPTGSASHSARFSRSFFAFAGDNCLIAYRFEHCSSGTHCPAEPDGVTHGRGIATTVNNNNTA